MALWLCYHLIISLTTNTSLNFYKKSLVYAEQFIFQTLTGCLISMHLQYNSSRNREYRLILHFVIILNNTGRPLMSFWIVRLPHVDQIKSLSTRWRIGSKINNIRCSFVCFSDVGP